MSFLPQVNAVSDRQFSDNLAFVPVADLVLSRSTHLPSKSLLFIDAGVDDIQTLVQGAAAGTEVHVLRSGEDAIAQITQTLLGRSGIESLQIVSHGQSGGLKLGESWLDLQSLPGYVGQLKSWGNSLSENADILLYGCDVAADASGKAFVNLLAQATGADVAASEDLTGNAALGGDWDLEVRTGAIATQVNFGADNAYRGTLASFGGTTNVGVGIGPWSVTTGDVNRDGKLDLLTANRFSNSVSVRLGNGTGGFTNAADVSVVSQPIAVTLGDVNGDGNLDLLAANYNAGSVSVRLGNGTGSFSGTTNISVGSRPISVTLGDVNGDGNLDLLAANDSSSVVAVRLGDGTGGFSGTTNVSVGTNPYSVKLGDVNADGKLDLVTANYSSNNVSVRLGDGTGGFSGTTNVSVGTTPWSVALGDVNGDGKLDLLTADYDSNNVSVRLGDGTGGFSGTTNISVGSNPSSVTLGDVNGDGKPDLLTVNDGSGNASVRLGSGAGGFSGTTDVNVGANPRFVTLGDVNGDGKLDLIAANYGSNSVSVRLNTTPKVTVAAGTAPVEGNGNGSFVVTLDQPAPVGGLVVNYSLGGTATNGTDYSLNQAASTNITAIAPGSFTIAAGQTTATIAIVATNDGTADPGETIGLNILAGDYFRDNTIARFVATPNPSVGSFPLTATLGDVNGDGNLDLFTSSNNFNNVSVRLGNGAGGFTGSTNIGVGDGASAVVVADVNGDGQPDFLAANSNSNNVSVRLGDGAGNFTGSANISVGDRPLSMTLGDVNGDGKLDFLVANTLSNTVSVRLGDGAGNFTGSTNISVGNEPRSVKLGDVNGDGKLDLLTANYDANNVSIRLGDGTGNFTGSTNISVGSLPYAVTLGDVNRDGKLDFLTANGGSGNVSVRLGDGTGNFIGSTNISVGNGTYDVTLGDVNGDGKLDLLTANANFNTVSVRLGDGAGNFTGNTNISVGADPRSVTLGDVNGDGLLDFVTANFSSNGVSIRLNQPGADLAIAESPILALPGTAPTYTENAASVLLDTTAIVSDSDSTNFDTGTLTVRFTANGSDADRLAIRNQGTGATQINLDGRKIRYGTTVIGTYTGGIGTENLVITFNAAATPIAAQALVRNLTYANVSDNPSLSPRTVEFVLTDGDGGTSTAATKTVNVVSNNDAALIASRQDLYKGATASSNPTAQGWNFTVLGGAATPTIDANGVVTLNTNTAVYAGYSRSDKTLDANAGFVLSFQTQVLAEVLALSANKNNDGKTDRAVLALTLITSDPSKAIEFGFSKTANGVRIFAQADGTRQINPALEPDTPTADFTRQLFTQAEGVDITTSTLDNYDLYVKANIYTLFRNGTAILSGNLRDYRAWNNQFAPAPDPYETPNLISFSDATASASGSFRLGNIALLSGPIANQTILEDTATTALAFGTFDVEGNPVTVSAGSNNTAVVTNANIVTSGTGATQTVTVTPIVNANGASNITLTANDATDNSTNTFSLTVSAVNDAPSFTPGANLTSTAGSGVQTLTNWASFAPGGGTDEASQTATYEIVSNSNPSLFTVAPTIDANGTLSYQAETTTGTATIEVRVKDNGGTANSGIDTSAIQTFTIAVNPQTVNLSAIDATATETLGDTGIYRISRDQSGGTQAIAIDISGTTAATDYNFSLDAASLAAGATINQVGNRITVNLTAGLLSVDLIATATDDIQAEAAETIQLNLATSAAYTIGTNNAGIVTIAQNDFTIINTNDSGEGSLRQAILNANAIAGIDTIDFAGTMADTTADTITLTSGELAINSDITLTGTGANRLTVSGNNASRVFNIASGTVNMSGLTIANGSAYIGGGIFNSGTLSLGNSTLNGNSAYDGGSIFNSGTLSLNNSTLSGNFASHYGGGILDNGTLSLSNSTLSGNSAYVGGGIATEFGRFSLSNSTLSGNSASYIGGGIYNYGSTVGTLTNTLFADSSLHNVTPDATNLVGTTAALGLDSVLRDNDGPTKTHAILPGSSAIDAAGAGSTTTDQRGIAAVGTRDIGAFESRGFTITTSSGTPQSTSAGSRFSTPLAVTVTSDYSEPVAGGTVAYSAPTSGASTTTAAATATIDATGKASLTATANNTPGTYTVTAGSNGIASPASFSLTNINLLPIANDDNGFTTNADTVLSISSDVPVSILQKVPEAGNYRLAYSLDIPVDGSFNSSTIPYSLNNSAGIGSFDRVAYYLELTNGTETQWTYVSMDAFTTNAAQIGIPASSTGVTFQQKVNNMNVFSNVAGVTPGTGIATGNIEFWPSNYATGSGLSTIPGNNSTYDFNDVSVGGSGYGSMQIHNYGTGQTIFGYNRWGGGGGSDDLGIGNAPIGNPDWTFGGNAASYTVRQMHILVRAGNTGMLLANDTDANNDPLTVTAFDATSTLGATVNVNANGTFTYNPTGVTALNALAAGQSVVDTFTYTASDGITSTDPATVSITVTGVNDAPTMNGTPATTIAEDSAYSFIPVGADVDANTTLTYSIVNPPAWATFNTTTGELSGTPTNANVGITTGIVISVNDGTVTTALSAFDLTVTNTNDAPTISGTPATTIAEDSVYSFTPTAADVDSGAALTYSIVNKPTWATFNPTTGALTGTPVNGDVGTTNGIVISVSDSIAPAVDLAAFNLVVTNTNDAPTGAVTISGTTTQGQTLTATNTLADVDGLGTMTYQWQADGVDIAGANTDTWVLGQAQVGKVITAKASYTDLQTTPESVTSTATAAIANINDLPTGTVTISGTATEDQTLTASNTLADADGLGTVAYQWQADGIDIAGATGATLVLDQAQVGKAIGVKASYIDQQGTPESLTSVPTGLVGNINDAPIGTVTINGVPIFGQTLTIANDLSDADGMGAITYQWQADGVDIVGAIGTSFVLGQAEVGKVITAKAGYIDAQGTTESVLSSPTAPITGIQTPNNLTTIAGISAQSVANWATDLTQPGYPAGLSYVVTADRPELFAQLPSISSTGQLVYEPKPYVNVNALVNLTIQVKQADGSTDPNLTKNVTLNIKYKPEALIRNSATNAVGLLYIDQVTQLQAQRNLTQAGQNVTITPEWAISDTADFNRDGIADILLHNQSGDEVSMWMMGANGEVMATHSLTGQDGNVLKTRNLNWKVVGFADIDRDNILDIVWHNQQSDEVGFWFMNTDGINVRSYDYLRDGNGAILKTGNVLWQVKALADLDGDGDSDLLFQLPELNQTAIVQLNGAALVNYAYIASPIEAGFAIRNVGDSNGDRIADIYWQNAENTNVLIQTITAQTASNNFTPIGSIAPLQGIADLDLNNTDDLLFRSTGLLLNLVNPVQPLNTPLAQAGQDFQFGDSNWNIVQTDDFGEVTV
jgi:VCBS repeat-containing protein